MQLLCLLCQLDLFKVFLRGQYALQELLLLQDSGHFFQRQFGGLRSARGVLLVGLLGRLVLLQKLICKFGLELDDNAGHVVVAQLLFGLGQNLVKYLLN